ncbi:hypothetical protein ACH4VQ_25685 [Streptomyces anulatus]
MTTLGQASAAVRAGAWLRCWLPDRLRPSDASRARALHRLAAARAGLATITPAAAAPQQLARTA